MNELLARVVDAHGGSRALPPASLQAPKTAREAGEPRSPVRLNAMAQRGTPGTNLWPKRVFLYGDMPSLSYAEGAKNS